jgi:uncharacterized membrane protein YfcA
MDWIHVVGFVALGFCVGTIGTLLGAGGGFLLAPLLLLLYPHDNPETLTSISLAVVFFNAASGSVAYARMKRIDYRAGLLFAAAAVPGAIVGSFTTRFISRAGFDVLCGGVMVMAGVSLILGYGRAAKHLLGRERNERDDLPPRSYNLRAGIVISAVVGYLSSVLGIGGGFIHVPALARIVGIPVHTATATSHFILAIMALVGTITHLCLGNFHHQGLRRTLLLAVGVIPGAQLGAILSNRVSGNWILRGLGVVLLLVGLSLFRQARWP